MGAAVAQSGRTWLGNLRVTGSSPAGESHHTNCYCYDHISCYYSDSTPTATTPITPIAAAPTTPSAGSTTTPTATTTSKVLILLLPLLLILHNSNTTNNTASIRRTAASTVTEAKRRVWGDFRAATEKDFRSAPKCIWKAVRHLRRGKQGTIQAIRSKDGTLLNSTEGVVRQWKEHFEELLNPTNPPSIMRQSWRMMGDQRQVPWRKSLR